MSNDIHSILLTLSNGISNFWNIILCLTTFSMFSLAVLDLVLFFCDVKVDMPAALSLPSQRELRNKPAGSLQNLSPLLVSVDEHKRKRENISREVRLTLKKNRFSTFDRPPVCMLFAQNLTSNLKKTTISDFLIYYSKSRKYVENETHQGYYSSYSNIGLVLLLRFCNPQAHVISVFIKGITKISADQSKWWSDNQTTECLGLTFSRPKLMVSLPLTAGDRESDTDERESDYLLGN